MENDAQNISGGLTLALDKVQKWSADFYLMLPNIFAGLIILILFGIIAYALKRSVDAYFQRKDRIDLGRLLADLAFWAFLIFGCLVALTIVTPSLKPVDLISGLGLGSLAIGFAFKDILQNWLAGLLILLRLPFRRGDQISLSSEIEGTVVRIEPRATIIRTYDGKDIVVPNTKIYTSEVTIQTSQPKRRIQMDITVGYDYDIDFIRDIIMAALKPIEEIENDPAPQVLCWELGSTSLGMRIRWWIDSERSQEVISRARAVQAIKEAFQTNDIDPTDPDLVYTLDAHSADDPDGDGKPKPSSKKKNAPKSSPPPPTFEMGAEDPETYTRKSDDKSSTLLSDDELK